MCPPVHSNFLEEFENRRAQCVALLRCRDRSDTSTRAFFSSYKSIAKQQWINSVKRADWREGEEPTFTTLLKTPGQILTTLINVGGTFHRHCFVVLLVLTPLAANRDALACSSA